jgi:predicted RNase H-like HicB family nuclease
MFEVILSPEAQAFIAAADAPPLGRYCHFASRNIIQSMAKRSDPFTVIVEQDEEGWFVANVPELRGCHTQAKSLDVLMKRVVEAIAVSLADEPRRPRRRFIAVQQVQVA